MNTIQVQLGRKTFSDSAAKQILAKNVGLELSIESESERYFKILSVEDAELLMTKLEEAIAEYEEFTQYQE